MQEESALIIEGATKQRKISSMSFDNPAFEKSPSPSEHSVTVTKEPNGDNEDLEMEDLSDNQTVQDIFYTTCDPPISAISVRNAHKSYHKGTPVLTDFHMKVPIGTIYSLLGSSGCGKTTLLSCCVGIRKLDKGDILVFGHKPGTKESGVPGRRVGFMPQELSIYNELTIQEALNFYGRIYGMKRDQIFESTSFLVDFLDLPKASRRVGSLSGGQKRRVSIALALIHDPELLILDEPTVGVDPLLRESIWNHLVKLVTSGRTTVIITTHYIEEARQSNVIGIMRNGRLLAEKSPEALLIEYKVTLLEDIVLTLCRQDREEKKRQRDDTVETSAKTEWGLSSITKRKIGSESTIVEEGTIVGLRYESAGKNGNNDDAIFVESPKLRPGTGVLAVHNNGHISAPLKQRRLSTRENIRMNHSTQIQKLTALLIKNFIILMRNIGFLIFIFFVPAIQVILICLTIGSDPKSLLLGVINPENCDYLSKNWRDIGKECPIDTDALENSTLSCFYLSNLPEESYILEKETSEFNALQRIQKGYTYGYIEFPRDYTSNVLCKFGGKFDCPSHDEVIAGSNIILELDMSNKQIGQTMKRIFVDTYAKTTEAIKTNCQGKIKDTILSSVADLPYTFKKPVYGKDDTSFREFLAPSILLGLLFFFPLCSSGVSYITEKKSGTLDRALVAGVGTTELMGGFLISQVGILLGQAGFAFLILTQVFRIEILGSISLALSLTILVGISGMSAGFLLAMFCSEEVQAVLLAIGTFFPNILLAGMVWPLEGMERGLQYVSYLLPCTLACESMRSIISRGWGLGHGSVWPGFLSTLAWIIVYWVLAVTVHKIRNKI